MMFRAVFWVVLPYALMMEAVRTSETSVDNHFTRQYNPEDSSEHQQKMLPINQQKEFRLPIICVKEMYNFKL
jgi:hypothetical protein